MKTQEEEGNQEVEVRQGGSLVKSLVKSLARAPMVIWLIKCFQGYWPIRLNAVWALLSMTRLIIDGSVKAGGFPPGSRCCGGRF